MAYGARTGVTTLIKFVKLLCKLYNTFSTKIDQWVLDQVDPSKQAQVQAFLALIAPVCHILEATPDD